MTKVIADTSFLVAILDKSDSLWNKAKVLQEEMKKQDVELLYLDCVINEVISVLCRRYEERRRLDELPVVLNRFRSKFTPEKITWGSIEIRRLYGEILDLVIKHAGRLNFHDVLIALIAREQEILFIVGFDRDFDEIAWLRRIGESKDVVSLLGDLPTG